MNNIHEEPNRWGRFHFELSLSPNFDALVRLRKPKNKNIERVQIDSNNKVAQSAPITKTKTIERAASGELLLRPTTVKLSSLNNVTQVIPNKVLL